MNNYVDKYIRVNNYSEYIRILNYWRDKLPDYNIIYTTDTNPEEIESIFNSGKYSIILIAGWIAEDSKELEIEIFHNDNIDKGIVNYIDVLEKRGELTIINSEDIR